MYFLCSAGLPGLRTAEASQPGLSLRADLGSHSSPEEAPCNLKMCGPAWTALYGTARDLSAHLPDPENREEKVELSRVANNNNNNNTFEICMGFFKSLTPYNLGQKF